MFLSPFRMPTATSRRLLKRWVGVVDVVRTGIVFENGTFPAIEPPKRLPCPAIYKTMPVHNDGRVRLCCLDGSAPRRSATSSQKTL